MRDEASDHLARRVAALDAPPRWPAPDHVDPQVYRFVTVMSEVTAAGPATAEDPGVVAEPAAADGVVAASTLLRALRTAGASTVDGPLDRDRQVWIATARTGGGGVPAADLVRAPAAGAPSTKPFHTGLFTSTATASTYGGWHTYLELNRGVSLFPTPWQVWALRIPSAARVREIASAADWAFFVTEYGTSYRGIWYPRWDRVAGDIDAIHVTYAAVAAAQGVTLRVGDRLVAPPYWDVETTFWLRWCADSVKRLAVLA